jgi:hypothetical protein
VKKTKGNMKILNKIQKELKAPKGQVNKFGNYRYRSCEDILEAVKPLLGEAVLTISDEIVQIGDRYYVKATATIKEGDESVSSVAFAREGLEKKGMDVSQITGSTSSYARKYALNGLLLIDDTKDADTKDNRSAEPTIEIESEAFAKANEAIQNETDTKALTKLKTDIAKSVKLTDDEKRSLIEIADTKIYG